MPATSTVLTGLSLAIDIAGEATDGVPIVKQVLGVVSRIVGLAEQVDQNREDLHALVERAKKMDATITDIVGDRELDDRLLRRLEDMNGILRAVEKHFENHIRKGRVRKTLGHIFTVRKNLDRLKTELDDRLKEFEVAANLDTNLFAREDSRFLGEFRNIRHCELTLLRPIAHPESSEGRYTPNCYLATCEGSNKVFIVRDTVFALVNEHARASKEAHCKILEHMSLIQNRHPGVASLYGRNTGPKHNRFLVLDAGDVVPLPTVIHDTADLSVLGQIVAKLAAASCHLHKHGAVWMMWDVEGVYLDRNYEPKIGIADDLGHMMHPEYHINMLEMELAGLLDMSCPSVRSEHPQRLHTHFKSTAWSSQLFGELIGAGYNMICRKHVVRRTDLITLIPLSPESRMHLRQSERRCGYMCPTWGCILLHLMTGNRNVEGSILHAMYLARPEGARPEDDDLHVVSIESDVEAIYYVETSIGIPPSATDEVRQRLGIPVLGGDKDREISRFFLERFAGAGAPSLECTGWHEHCGQPW